MNWFEFGLIGAVFVGGMLFAFGLKRCLRKTKLKIRCAWCKKDMGKKDGKGQEGTSDGICDDCLLHNFPHIYEKIKQLNLGG